MQLTQAPRGINVVVETSEAVYIGRVGSVEGRRMQLHHAAVFPLTAGQSAEALIRKTAKFGVPVEHQSLVFEAEGQVRVRRLGDVPKA